MIVYNLISWLDMGGESGNIVYKEDIRKEFLNPEGKVDWNKV